jgi:AcrR family transcriptional regulator
MSDIRPPRRRSGLLQDRSRRTRQLLIRCALQLWSERGFEDGIERTAVDEIVKAAGVTKGTFYFHFARKEEILLEMGYGTAEVVLEEAERCVARERPLDDSMRRLIAVMSRHVRAAPPAAVGRSLAEFRRRPRNELLARGPHIADGLEIVFQAAIDRGEFGDQVDAQELAAMTAAVMMETFIDWVRDGIPLTKTLNRRANLLLEGARGGG